MSTTLENESVIFMNTDLITKVEKIEPRQTEVIVLRFKVGAAKVDEMSAMLDCVKSAFPNNAVIAIPDYASLKSCSKNSLNNIIGVISKIVDGL